MQKKIYLALCVALIVILVSFLLLHPPQQTDNPASQAADTHKTTDNKEHPKPSKKSLEEAQKKMNLQAAPTNKAYVWIGEMVVGAILLGFFPQYKIIVYGSLVLLLLL